MAQGPIQDTINTIDNSLVVHSVQWIAAGIAALFFSIVGVVEFFNNKRMLRKRKRNK